VIAQHLYDSLVPSASVGDLLVGIFRIDDSEPWLALLKMQPEMGYTPQASGSEGGEDRQFLIDQMPILTSGVLQKCAFFPPRSLRTERYHVKVLDEQAGHGGDEHVAAFFLQDFLQCVRAPTLRQQTRAFVALTGSFVTAYPGIGTLEERNTIRAAARVAIEEPSLSIIDFAREHIANPVLHDAYLDHLRDGGIVETVFAPEPPTRRRGPRVILRADRFRLDIGDAAFLREIRDVDDPSIPPDVKLYEISPFGGMRRFVLRAPENVDVVRRR